jgi:hypothetical protein
VQIIFDNVLLNKDIKDTQREVIDPLAEARKPWCRENVSSTESYRDWLQLIERF